MITPFAKFDDNKFKGKKLFFEADNVIVRTEQAHASRYPGAVNVRMDIIYDGKNVTVTKKGNKITTIVPEPFIHTCLCTPPISKKYWPPGK